MSELPLSQLLSQLSHELGALQLMASDMEATIDDMIERHATVLDARSIQNLQLLDILNQTLLALARFAANTATLAPPAWQLDGLATVHGIRLASLAQRLAQGAGQAHCAEGDSYELFSDAP